MKKIVVAIASLGLMAGSVAGASYATAAPGSLTGVATSISWDDSNWYIPTGCSDYTFNYTSTPAAFLSEVTILNQFGDKLGSKSVGGGYGEGGSGSVAVQVCSFRVGDDVGQEFPVVIQLEDKRSSSYGDGGSQILTGTAVFKTRRAPAPEAEPAPAPTPTVGEAVKEKKKNTIVCVNKKTFEVKTFKKNKKTKNKKKGKCPKGWTKAKKAS